MHREQASMTPSLSCRWWCRQFQLSTPAECQTSSVWPSIAWQGAHLGPELSHPCTDHMLPAVIAMHQWAHSCVWPTAHLQDSKGDKPCTTR
jgi:hypothetical protein